MKKSLLALAVLTAVSGAAFAQSSVTLYGKVDLGMVYDAGNPLGAGKSVRLSSGVTGGSRIGFKGVEDLGGGNKFSFQLETGYCADSAAGQSTNVNDANNKKIGTTSAPNFCTGSNNFMGRQAHGDLTGAFGALSAGRQYSLGFNNLATIDPFGAGFAAQANNVASNGTYLVDPSGIRLNNSVTYSTPNVAGFTGSVEAAFGEVVGNWKSGRETGAGVNYASGPVYAGITYYEVNTAAGSGTAKRVTTFGGSYDFGVVKVHALGQKVSGSNGSIDIFNIMGGVTVPVGAGSLMASYVKHNDRTSMDEDANQIGIGYQYPLSKRTALYTSFARIQNHNIQGSATSNSAILVGNATDAGTGQKAFNAGVVHNF